MATLTEAQDAYDRHDLRVGVIHSDVADVILRLETEIGCLRKWLRDLIAVDDQDIDTVVARMLAPDIEPS